LCLNLYESNIGVGCFVQSAQMNFIYKDSK
jgi:hypothetical protein